LPAPFETEKELLMTEENKAKHKAALKSLDILGIAATGNPNFDTLYTYCFGLHVMLEKIVEDL
jgi:hypothetical protein